MLHKKGPTEIRPPTVFCALSGHLNEQSARLPSAIANLAGLLALFLRSAGGCTGRAWPAGRAALFCDL
jgi:4-amino-4-deoxy-L-arabinose transferase-like glycosyltransferase